MKLSELINYKSNMKRLEIIRKNRENIVPFVGAGISKGCGLYTWEELLDKLAVEYFTIEEIQKLKEEKNVFEYAEEIVNVTGNTEMIMRRIREILSESKVVLTEIPYLLVSMFSPMVVTTNYDTLLEESSLNSKLGLIKPLLPCLRGQMNDAIQLNERRLLKLHGSVEEISSFVFSMEQYRKFYGEIGERENKILPAYLRRIFEDKKVLFVGCSLDKDYTLEILKECIERNPHISHYAIVPYLTNEKQQVLRQREYTSWGIEPIYYPERNYQAVGKLVNYLADENPFISSIRIILTNILGTGKEREFQNDILVTLLKESFYNTSVRFPQILDIDNIKDNYELDIIEAVGYERKQSDTLFEICINAFSAYVRMGYVSCEQEVINYFREKFTSVTLKETDISEMLKRKWSIKRNLSYNQNQDFVWLKAVSTSDINQYANDYVEKLQYKNGMNFSDIVSIYNNAKKFMEYAGERLEFNVKIKLLNSLGAFGHYCRDFNRAEEYLEECIEEIERSGKNDRDLMLFKAKCYANIAIVRGMQNTNIIRVLEAAEKDIAIKKEYNESEILYSRSLNYYATVMKELNPFKAVDIYLETIQIKKKLIKSAQNEEQNKELTASWATTVFNIGLLAKDLELYELAYKIIFYGNTYRFATVDYCNRDYCSSINVYAELELYVHEKKNLERLVQGIQSRIDLPEGFSNTLGHTWYICAYYFFLKKEYKTAIKYVEKAIYELRKEGAIFDFRQEIRIRLLLGNIKAEQGKVDDTYITEAERLYKAIIADIICIYGDESFFLIAPYRCLLQLENGVQIHDKDKNHYQFLTQKYKPYIRETRMKLEKFMKDVD